MSKPLSIEELQDGEQLCKYCVATGRGIEDIPRMSYGYNGPVMCEGMHCDDAYEYYLENFESSRSSSFESFS